MFFFKHAFDINVSYAFELCFAAKSERWGSM
jgi:hypothetical protein